jgi:hypothetical protein
MTKISVTFGILLTVLVHPVLAQDEGQKIATVCAVDFERLCARRIALPNTNDFQRRGIAYGCLEMNVSQLSRPCYDAIMGSRAIIGR